MSKTKLVYQQHYVFTSLSTGFSAAMLLIVLVSLLGFIIFRGSTFFWPMTIYKVSYDAAPSSSIVKYEISPLNQQELTQNLSNRLQSQYLDANTPAPRVKIEKAEGVYQVVLLNGKVALGTLQNLSTPSSNTLGISSVESAQQKVSALLDRLNNLQLNRLAGIHEQLAAYDRSGVANNAPARIKILEEFNHWQKQVEQLNSHLIQYTLEFSDAQGFRFVIELKEVDKLFVPNEMSIFDKLGFMLSRITQFLSDAPKQSAQTGGVFPALFGTVLMVVLMALLVAPLGVMTAIYLHEYAPDNLLTSFIRIGISNMAGVPSVVYGVFGLGFFVYVVGGSIDALLFSDNLPSPTFGTPGLFWAALTMALLTLPVVIVSTEEGLRRVPSGLRAGAYALGATKFETVTRTIVPIASPGMITGLILAVARAAGEVAPLILVGAVKYAPTLPVDSEFPFLHLERQFMHLGVFIYDGAFHNQTNTQGSAMMFASCLLLLFIVFILNLFAIIVRSKLRQRYLKDNG